MLWIFNRRKYYIIFTCSLHVHDIRMQLSKVHIFFRVSVSQTLFISKLEQFQAEFIVELDNSLIYVYPPSASKYVLESIENGERQSMLYRYKFSTSLILYPSYPILVSLLFDTLRGLDRTLDFLRDHFVLRCSESVPWDHMKALEKKLSDTQIRLH